MCYLFYYTECSFLLVSFFFMMILMPWISIAVVFKCAKLWYRWCVINKITYIFLYLLIFFCHFGVCFIQMAALSNEKWAILSALPCDRLNYHPLPCDRLNWNTLLNQWEDRKFTWNIIKYIVICKGKSKKKVKRKTKPEARTGAS